MGYVFLPGFHGDTRHAGGNGGRNATDDVRALLARFRERKLEGVILDLRGSGGGLLTHATAISGLFIAQGPVVEVHALAVGSEVSSDEDPEIVYSGKLGYLENPIPWSKRKPLEHEPWSSQWSATVLRERSEAEQREDASFARVEARSASLEARTKFARDPCVAESAQLLQDI